MRVRARARLRVRVRMASSEASSVICPFANGCPEYPPLEDATGCCPGYISFAAVFWLMESPGFVVGLSSSTLTSDSSFTRYDFIAVIIPPSRVMGTVRIGIGVMK